MKHRTIVTTLFFLLACVASTMMLTSCNEEIYSAEPVYGTLFFSADSIDFQGEIHNTMTFAPGQTVYAGITIEDAGAYITRADQTWTLRGDTADTKITKSVIAPCGKEPVCTFTAPDEVGEYTVTFKEKYSFSASKPDGTIFGQSSTLTAKFRVK